MTLGANIQIVSVTDGLVICTPPRKKVAIVGFASSSRDLAPYHDPAYEMWGLNQAYEHFQRSPDRWFEIHRPEAQEDPAVPTYLEDLKKIACPVYMIDVDPAIPTSVRFPLERVCEHMPLTHQRYFTATMGYMIALAIAEGFETIGLYGVDCATGTEYEQQKACVESWLSLAMGRGIEVIIPPTSALFKSPFLYGYEAPKAFPRVLHASEQFLKDRISTYKVRSNETLANLHRMEGAVDELEGLLKFAESKARGASYPTIEAT